MREHNHIALVREKGDRIVGMITLEDVVEELVGEIHDEFDRLPAGTPTPAEGSIAGGFVPLASLHEWRASTCRAGHREAGPHPQRLDHRASAVRRTAATSSRPKPAASW